MTLIKFFRVYHCVKNDINYSYFLLLEHKSKKDSALLFKGGFIRALSSQEAESYKRLCTRLPDAYGCLGVLSLSQGDGPVQYLVLVNSCLSVGKIQGSEIFRITETNFISLQNNQQDIERIQEIKKLLNCGTFYFSWSSAVKPLDLTLCEQRSSFATECDNRFFWNKSMHVPFILDEIDCNEWLLKIMCGGIEIRTIYVGHLQARGCIFSRLSSERAGTRFNVRGTNDEGCVANFVETEQVIYLDDKVCSYVQIRGSIPLFWEQPGLQVGSHKVKLSRGTEASAPSFDRHLTQILNRYGDQVLINLLGCKESEALLSQMFQNHHKASRYAKQIPYVYFDYHAQCKGGRQDNLISLKRKLATQLKSFGFFLKSENQVEKQQSGTFRTNCLDCLDRTNNVQTFIGLEVLEDQLSALSIPNQPQILSRFNEVFKQMWIANGDHVSKMYAGTCALEGKSKLRDGSRSVVRTIQNNLLDNSKQEAIDVLLLGSCFQNEVVERARSLLPHSMLNLPTGFLNSFCEKKRQFTKSSRLLVAVATWNVNGGQHFNSIVFKHQSMTEWLLDCPVKGKKHFNADVPNQEGSFVADIYAIGFEEIVDLNASNIVSASSQNQKEWMVELQKTISRENKYVYVTSTQLVGVCLFVFALAKHAPFIKDVAVDVVKTGLGGTTGNKGGVAIRLDIYNTSMCFVCAHLTAGQSQVLDRNADYHEISRRISFPMGKNLDSHDYIFWCGDFNYRIDLTNDEAKKLIKERNFEPLFAADQLQQNQKKGLVFKGFTEAPINFAPTYKYDIFSDDYDTSEKNRIPSWTDRVLFRRKQVDDCESSDKIVFYGSAELKTSDHRPVIAYIDVEVFDIDKIERQKIFCDLLSSEPLDASVIVWFLNSLSSENLDSSWKNKTLYDIFKEKVQHIVVYENDIIMVFKANKDALVSLQQDGTEVDGWTLKIKLKTSEGSRIVANIVKLCRNNTLPLNKDSKIKSDEDVIATELVSEDDCPDHLHDLVDKLNKEVLKRLNSHDEWTLAVEGYNEPDYEASSGRSSPCFDEKSAKLPPRPPPPSKAPQRPPPPTKLDPSSDQKKLVQETISSSTASENQTRMKDAMGAGDSAEGIQSHPPPSAPPPPPPSAEYIKQSKSNPKSGSGSKSAAQFSEGNPPPIPARPSSKPPENAEAPPPIPARSSCPPTSK